VLPSIFRQLQTLDTLRFGLFELAHRWIPYPQKHVSETKSPRGLNLWQRGLRNFQN
jgi:hypothetical protein